MTLSEMLARNARMYPEKTALIERTSGPGLRKEICWRSLDERVNRLGNGLLAKGVRKGDKVMIWMRNSLNWLEAYLGVLRIGAWAVPLNHRFTSREFSYCMEIAEPGAMIIDGAFLEKVQAAGELACPKDHLIVVGDETPPGMTGFEALLSASAAREIACETGDEEPCGLYFTSGTTGEPKPILLMHKNMECAAITAVVHGFRKPGDIFVILKPLYHTGDKMHWLSSLILGEKAVIQRGRITPQAILGAIHEERGTVAMLLVPWIQDILTALDQGKLRKADYDLSSWRLVLFGAQPVPPGLVRRWRACFPEIEYDINFGMTESAGPGCIHLSMADEHKLGSIGRPGFNWEACIVNAQGEQVGPGEIGEIALKGNGVMKEYYQNQEQTARTLRKGWLHTGDIGRMDEQGFFWLVDRKKDVIFYGGENVYPAEIEEVLQNHPLVHDVAVIGVSDSRLGEVVAAVIELEPAVEASAETEQAINLFCVAQLPKYKRPRQIIFAEVPRSPTGKIEKIKLRQQFGY